MVANFNEMPTFIGPFIFTLIERYYKSNLIIPDINLKKRGEKKNEYQV